MVRDTYQGKWDEGDERELEAELRAQEERDRKAREKLAGPEVATEPLEAERDAGRSE